MTDERIPIGVWIEANSGDQWANQGMTRLLGFILEGLALVAQYKFCIVLPDYIRDEAQADLAGISAQEGVDYSLHSPRDHGEKADNFMGLVTYANRHVPVEGWLALFPQYDHACHLAAPVTAIFPDAIPLAFPDFSGSAWDAGGHHVAWHDRVERLLGSAAKVITFSEHVARRQVVPFFGVDEARTRVIHVAPPDLMPLLPFLGGRRRTPESRAQAARILRGHVAEHGPDYLDDFPFEEIPYVAVSTQDRVTKNIRIVADSILRSVRENRRDIRLIMTAPLLIGTRWTPLPTMIESFQAHRDILSIPNLPRSVHAAFYHAADVAVHPSIFEGGMGSFPFYEAVSVGTPCLMADGPHEREMVSQIPQLARFVFDPNDADGLARLMRDVCDNREEVLHEQLAAYDILCGRSWKHVAADYATAVTGESSTDA